MKLVMPMAGRARRFNENSDELIIKPLIEVQGKNLFRWAISSLNIDIPKIFIIQKEHYALKQKILEFFPDSQIVELDDYTNGPVETLSRCFNLLTADETIIVCDCDLYFESPEFTHFLSHKDESIESGVLTFVSDNPSYSYVKLKGSQVFEIKEKEVISHNAVCGCYYFNSADGLIQASKNALNRYGDREVYMSDVIRMCLESGGPVRAFTTQKHVSLGTPEEISTNETKLAGKCL